MQLLEPSFFLTRDEYNAAFSHIFTRPEEGDSAVALGKRFYKSGFINLLVEQ
jgi:hypothetical protein